MKNYIYTAGGVTTRLTFLSDGILRITHTKRETFLERNSAVVTCKSSLTGELKETSDTAVFAAGRLQVRVDRKSGALCICTADGQSLLREPCRNPHQLVEKQVILNRFDPDNPAVRAVINTEEVQAITINPARHIGVDDRVGSLETGKDADLVLTKGDPMVSDSCVKYVIVDGKVLVS